MRWLAPFRPATSLHEVAGEDSEENICLRHFSFIEYVELNKQIESSIRRNFEDVNLNHHLANHTVPPPHTQFSPMMFWHIRETVLLIMWSQLWTEDEDCIYLTG